MSGTTTTYAIEVLYKTRDSASGGLDKIGQGAERASKSTGGLVSALRGVGAALAGYGAFRLGKSMFIDFNSSIEQSTISLAAQEKMLLGGRWDTAMSHATGLFQDYQQVAKNSVGETKDFLEMHQMIASSAMQAGLGMKQLKEMTVGATIAAAALGERADMVALDVKQMLAGTVGARDRTAQIFLASQGISQERFNRSSAADRAKITMRALNDPALKSAAKAMGESFAGVTSTLKDNLSIALGKIGLPLFKSITAEIAKWNTWIEKHPEKIKQWAADFTSALKTGFDMVKKIAGFIVEHRDLLMTLAKAYLVGKGVGLVTGSVQGVVGSLAQLNGGGLGSLAGFARSIGGVSTLLAGVAATATLLADHADDMQTRRIDSQANWGTARRSMGELGMAQFGGMFGGDRFSGRDAAFAATAGTEAAQSRIAARVLATARAEGYIRGGKVDENAIFKTGSQAGIMVPEIQGYISTLNRLLDHAAWATAAKAIGSFNAGLQQIPSLVPAAARALMDPAGLFIKGLKALPNANSKDDASKPPKQNVNVSQHNEVMVMTDDPDRFAVAMTSVAVDYLKNPRGSRHVFREGA